jgi:ABC-2 type transport system permease protein
MAEPRAAGTIYDLGYQRYGGLRLGRANAIWKLTQYSYRAAFGIGRGPRARLAPIVIGAVTLFPAIGQIAAASLTGQTQIINYPMYLSFTAFFVALFAAAQAPELVVGDKQHGVLALYLSRPLRGTDYALAKLCAILLAMLTITLTPQLMLFVAKVFLAPETPWTALKAEYGKLLPIVGGTIGTSLYMGSIGLAISSLCSRRAFANAGVIAYFLLMPAATTIFHNIATDNAKRYSVLAHPVWLLTGFTNWLFDIEAKRRSVIGRADLPPSAYLWAVLVISGLFVAVLMLRYRRSET